MLLILYEAPLIAFAWTVLFDSVVLALGFVYFFFKVNNKYTNTPITISNLKFKKSTAISLLRDSWPLILSSIITMLYMRIDQIMIKEMLDSESVGYYAAAVRLSETWYFVPTILAASLFPAILSAKKNNHIEYINRLQKFYSLMIAISLPISILLAFCSEFIVILLFGDAFKESVDIFRVHIFASVFVFLFVASGRWILTENYTMLSFYRNSIAAILNIILNYIFIPKYGAIGAAYGTIIAFAMAGYFFDLTSKKTYGQFVLKTKAFYLNKLIKIGSAK